MTTQPFTTPILFITFNRPEHTKVVMERIRSINPRILYVFQDGARDGCEEDIQRCKQVRSIINDYSADSSTNIFTFYSTENLGCGPGPAAAISWFFEHEDKGIIIEDDAVPDKSFFSFAEVMLDKYKDDSNIRAIGSMHLDNRTFGDGSYYFSMMNRTFCAWATWRRAWKDFDYYHRGISRAILNDKLKDYNCPLRMREYWCERMEEIQKDAYHDSSWDQQFWISIWIHNGKGVMPNVNLCKNIGFDEYGTHTTDSSCCAANKDTSALTKIIEPSSQKIITKADVRFQKLYFESYNYGLSGIKRLPLRINKRIKRLVNHQGSWIKKK